MAAPGGKAPRGGLPALLAGLRNRAAALPFLRKLLRLPPPGRKSPPETEDGADLALPGAPGAAPAQPKAPPRPPLDLKALLAALLSNKLRLGLIAATLLVLILVGLTAILVAAPPRAPAAARPSTPAGEALVKKLILPPDPARGLDYELERPPKTRYTEEDLRSLLPVLSEAELEAELAGLAARNDAAAEALFETVR